MEKEQALRLWEMLYGDRNTAYDYASHPMYKADFRTTESEGGWDVDYKQPLSKNGNTSMYNFVPTSLLTKAIRDGRTVFKIGNFLYEVRKGNKYGSFHIFDVTDRSHPIDMEPNNTNQDPTYNEERLKRSLERKESPKIDYANDLYSFRNRSIDRGIIEPEILSEDVKNEQAIEKLKEISLEATNEIKSANEQKEDVTKEFAETDQKETSDLEINKLKDEITTLKLQLNEKDHDISELNDRLLALDNKVEEKEQTGQISEEMLREEETSEIVVSDDEIDRLQTDLQSLKTELENKNQEIDRLNSALYENANQLNQIRDKQSLLESENGELKGRIASLQDNESLLNSYKIIAEQKGIEIKSLKDELKDKQNDIETLEKNNEQLLENKNKLENEKVSLTASLVYQSQQQQNLSTNVSVLQEENKKLQENLRQLEDKINEIEKEKNNLSSFNDELKRKEQESISYIEDNKQHEQEMQTIIADLKSSNEMLTRQISSENENKTELLKEIADLRDQFAKVEAKNAQLQEVLNEKDIELSQTKEKSTKDQELIEEKEQAFVRTSVENTELQQRFSELQEKYLALSSIAANTQDLQAKIDILNSDIKAKEEKNLITTKNNEDLQSQIKVLQQQVGEKTQKIDELLVSQQNDDDNLLNYQNQIEDLTAENVKKEEQIIELQKQKADKEQLLIELKAAQNELVDKETTLSQVQKNLKDSNDCLLFVKCGGDIKKYAEAYQQIITISEYNEENIKEFLLDNPNYFNNEDQYFDIEKEEVVFDEDISSLSTAKARKDKAIQYFHDLFGDNQQEVTDFAGREIKISEYNNSNSKYGWDYVLYDDNLSETQDNILIANLKSLKDFDRTNKFTSNGHTYSLQTIDGKLCVTSEDYVTDPYNFSQALQVSENELGKRETILYIVVRLIGPSLSIVEKQNVYKFIDVIDKTVRKCCPKSFIGMQINSDDGMDYILLTFDGTIDDGYKEVTEYAILINSYRRNFYNLNLLNAIIILDELQAPNALRHVSFKEMINKTDDLGLKAIRYELLHKVINSTIKRTIHVGKQISTKIPEYQTSLRPSQLAQGEFAEVYHSEYGYQELNLIYNLRRRTEQQ